MFLSVAACRWRAYHGRMSFWSTSERDGRFAVRDEDEIIAVAQTQQQASMIVNALNMKASLNARIADDPFHGQCHNLGCNFAAVICLGHHHAALAKVAV